MLGFERRRTYIDNSVRNTLLNGLQGELDAEQSLRLNKIRQAWDFYEGFHWEYLPEQDGEQITINYCRAFVDKLVAFELGKAFAFSVRKSLAGIAIDDEGHDLYSYLESVWDENDWLTFCTNLGQMKSVTGEAWVHVRYKTPEELEEEGLDPYNLYPKGKIELRIVPTSMIFPTYAPHDSGVLTSVAIMYTYERKYRSAILGRLRTEKINFKQIWTKDEVATYDGDKEPEVLPNKYHIIPFIQINNLPLACRNYGRGDLDDIIPINTSYNLKESNMSEIIDYHAAPITIVYGAKVGNLEKGANKMWGGLSKDSRVENLELRGDLGASNNFTATLKQAMCEVGGVPESSLGGALAISNTSGVALQYMNLPIIEKVRVKKALTERGLEKVNSLILLISALEGIIKKPANVTNRDFYYSEVKIPDTLPKDTLLELQQIEQEMRLGLESRRNAMKRLDKDDIDDLIQEIEREREEFPWVYGATNENEVNSGMTNGQTAIEQVRTEMTGANGGEN